MANRALGDAETLGNQAVRQPLLFEFQHFLRIKLAERFGQVTSVFKQLSSSFSFTISPALSRSVTIGEQLFERDANDFGNTLLNPGADVLAY
jgi:hypothetical protein